MSRRFATGRAARATSFYRISVRDYFASCRLYFSFYCHYFFAQAFSAMLACQCSPARRLLLPSTFIIEIIFFDVASGDFGQKYFKMPSLRRAQRLLYECRLALRPSIDGRLQYPRTLAKTPTTFRRQARHFRIDCRPMLPPMSTTPIAFIIQACRQGLALAMPFSRY